MLQLFHSYIIIIIIIIIIRITVAYHIPPIRAKTAEIEIFDSIPYFSKQGNVCRLVLCSRRTGYRV